MMLLHPPFAQPGPARERAAHSHRDMPSIEEFLDELPSIDDYVWPGDAGADETEAEMRSIDHYLEDSSVEADVFEAPPAVSDFDDDGWAIAEWQSFDWEGASLLGKREDAPPSSDAMSRSAREGHGSGTREISRSADETARALDDIAQRIRSGELKIDQLSGAPPEAAMAAALAALLRKRD